MQRRKAGRRNVNSWIEYDIPQIVAETGELQDKLLWSKMIQESPIHSAARNGDVEIIELLRKLGSDLEATNNRNQTPLFIAVAHGRIETVEFFLDHGAKVEAADTDGFTAIGYAVYYYDNCPEIFNILVKMLYNY